MIFPINVEMDVAETTQQYSLDVAETTHPYSFDVATPIVTGGSNYNWGNGLVYDSMTNTVSVDVVDDAIENESRPISSNGVYKEIGNVAILLGTI